MIGKAPYEYPNMHGEIHQAFSARRILFQDWTMNTWVCKMKWMSETTNHLWILNNIARPRWKWGLVLFQFLQTSASIRCNNSWNMENRWSNENYQKRTKDQNVRPKSDHTKSLSVLFFWITAARFRIFFTRVIGVGFHRNQSMFQTNWIGTEVKMQCSWMSRR